jgi:hypothetical protein
MRQYIISHDNDCRIITITDSLDSLPPPSAFIGTHPWDWCIDGEKELTKSHIMKIFHKKTHHRYAIHWTNPVDPADRKLARFYICNLKWVGTNDVAFLNVIREFPAEMSNLTEASRNVLWALGETRSVKVAAAYLKQSQRNIRRHLDTIRAKLELESVDDVIAFATLYVDAKEEHSDFGPSSAHKKTQPQVAT